MLGRAHGSTLYQQLPCLASSQAAEPLTVSVKASIGRLEAQKAWWHSARTAAGPRFPKFGTSAKTPSGRDFSCRLVSPSTARNGRHNNAPEGWRAGQSDSRPLLVRYGAIACPEKELEACRHEWSEGKGIASTKSFQRFASNTVVTHVACERGQFFQ